jgi:hypothetical protein
MNIEMKSIKLHGPLFCGGSNLSADIDTTKRTGLKIVYIPQSKWFAVTWNGKTKFVTESNVHDFEPMDPSFYGVLFGEHKEREAKVKTKGAAMTKAAPFTAQVETPHGLTRSKL